MDIKEIFKACEEAYLEYTNDFISIKKFAEYHDISIEQAGYIIDIGRIENWKKGE